MVLITRLSRVVYYFGMKLCLVLALILTVGNPVTASYAAQSAPTAKLSPCKLDVGIGEALSQIDAQCTTVSVPENPADPSGRKIDLAVTVLAATGSGEKGLPIFHLEGGPGASAITNFGQAFFVAYRPLRENHDIVLLDQRGTGKSSPLQCTEFTDKALEDLKDANEVIEGSADMSKRLSECLTRLAKTTDPAFYTSTIMADDTDLVRAALGYDKINLYGDSYGTWLGQIYLARHGEHVNAIVLDSVTGPWNNPLLTAASNARISLDKVFELCAADSTCDAVYPNLADKMQQALDLLDKEPQKAMSISGITGKPYAVMMTRGRFLEAIRQMLYSSANIGVLPQLISQGAEGNFILAASTLISGAEQSSMIALGLYYSVHCSESQPFYAKEAINSADVNAFYGKDESQNSLEGPCKVWRSAELDAADVAPVKSDRPVLILSGEYDPITSVAFAEETNARFTNSTLAKFPYQAHGPFATSTCAQSLVKKFFDNPQQKLDTSCVANDVKPAFLGAYSVDLTTYQDPSGKLSVKVPKDYAVDKTKSSGNLTFFANADQSELMAVGLISTESGKDVSKSVLEELSKAYGGPIDLQLTQVQNLIVSTLVIDQVGVTTKDGSAVGLLMLLTQGDEVRVVFLATPVNVLQAASLSIAVPALTSMTRS